MSKRGAKLCIWVLAAVFVAAALTKTATSLAPTAAAATPAAEEPSSVDPAPAPEADPAAERCLEQALAALKTDGLDWLEMGIWQKVQLPTYSFEADGTYRLAPGQRFRLEMHTHPAEGEGTVSVRSFALPLPDYIPAEQLDLRDKKDVDKILRAARKAQGGKLLSKQAAGAS